MKIIKLTAISAAVLASTAALAAEPVVVVDNNDAVVYEAEPAYVAATPSYQYDQNGGIIRNTTGAIFGGTKTLFNTAFNPAAVSAEIGTLGYGANIGWAMNDKTELQAGWAGGDVAELFGGDFDVNDINYDVDSDFSNPYLGVQIRPAGNWFTMAGGIIVPDNKLDVVANSDYGAYKIDNVLYNSADTGLLVGNVDHRNDLAPYVTLGFRPNINDRWGIFGEVGAAYLGKTEAKVYSSNSGGNVRFTNALGQEGITTADNVAAIAEAELKDKDYLEWLPIVKLGATYRF